MHDLASDPRHFGVLYAPTASESLDLIAGRIFADIRSEQKVGQLPASLVTLVTIDGRVITAALFRTSVDNGESNVPDDQVRRRVRQIMTRYNWSHPEDVRDVRFIARVRYTRVRGLWDGSFLGAVISG
ncbi:hypothetical protein M8C13_06160 [Crossiella sp. SN42]|uniref:hypothetical protein n=1 Tax=Crossiella sp. SN42 TaxID=2944808 RepID=UPI00207C6417|nr:hypothetical protein [Crossiella sp. SN42]MCO1575343.1 hypothetical protein [Crossiella sp. SN42]